MSGRQIIQASEVGEYAYCARAWWLHRVEGLSSANLEALARGTSIHLGHGRRVKSAGRFQWLAWLLVGLAALSLLLARLLGGGV
jgi:hypothetical protein